MNTSKKIFFLFVLFTVSLLASLVTGETAGNSTNQAKKDKSLDTKPGGGNGTQVQEMKESRTTVSSTTPLPSSTHPTGESKKVPSNSNSTMNQIETLSLEEQNATAVAVENEVTTQTPEKTGSETTPLITTLASVTVPTAQSQVQNETQGNFAFTISTSFWTLNGLMIILLPVMMQMDVLI